MIQTRLRLGLYSNLRALLYFHYYSQNNMDFKRKSNFFSESKPRNRSNSSKKGSPKAKHLLLKPKQPVCSLTKHTQSSSTMHSSTFSKTFPLKITKTAKQRKPNAPAKTQELDRTIVALKNTQKKLTLNGEADIKRWYQAVESIKSTTQDNKIKQLITSIQAGYSNLVPVSTKQLQQHKKQSSMKAKLGLNIAAINKQNIRDYHDQFMDRLQQCSPSWRQLAKQQRTYCH